MTGSFKMVRSAIVISMLDQFLHRSLRIPYRLHIAHHGKRNQPVLVLLHGIGASMSDWDHFLPSLSEHHHCITIDLLGCGKSPKPQWSQYFPGDHISALRHTIKKLRLKDYTLIGHSLGSLLGTQYASRYPEGIKHLILLSPPVYPEVKHIRNHLARQRTSILLALYRSTRRSFVTPALMSRLAFILPPARLINNDPAMWVPALRTLEHCIEQQTILEDIKQVQAPVDIWYGIADEVVIGTNVEQLQRHNPAATLHTYKGRHLLTPQYAEVFTTWLLQSGY